MKFTTLFGIFLLHFIHFSHSQLFEYDCVSSLSSTGTYFNADEQTPFGVVFIPPIDGRLNRVSLLKISTDLNGTAYLYEGAVSEPGLQDPLSSMDFYNTNDTDLLSVEFDSVEVSAGVNYTVFITLTNTSFAVFFEGNNTGSGIAYFGSLLPYAAAQEICIRYTVAIEQDYSSVDGLTTDEITTIVAAVGVPLVSLLIAFCGVLLRHGLTKPSDKDEESNKSSVTIGKNEKANKFTWPKFPKTSKAEMKQIRRESEAPSSNEGSENELIEESAESSNSE